MTDQPTSRHDDLSFDRAIPVSGTANAGAAAVQCSVCKRAITESYHTVNGAAVCDGCRMVLTGLTAPVQQPVLLVKALVLGVGASLAGAFVYWAVIRFFSLEIGIVAVLNGWMVGKAVRAGADGRGGRVLQIAAALLTYASVAMAYLPFALSDGGGLGIGMLLPALALPVMVILGSLPGGLISALIIGFGMLQAWQLTGIPAIDIQGPFRVGSGRAA